MSCYPRYELVTQFFDGSQFTGLNMPTKAKIKILDNPDLRTEIDNLYDSTSQVTLAQWAI